MDEMKRMNKGFMRKNGKAFLPVTHESLVLDNDGLSIDEKYLTKLEAEDLATEDYVRQYVEQAQLGGGIDPDTLAKLEDLEKKVDKEEGKSLVPNEEIEKLATLENYDDTEIRTLLANKAPADHNHDTEYASKDSEHRHINKAVLDEITLVRMNTWDDKSNFSGSYNDLTDKPVIPSIEGLATEQFVEQRIEDAIAQKGESGGEVIDMNKFATKAYVQEQIDLIELTPGPAGKDGVDGVNAENPNFTFAINMIESDQAASVSTTGTYPNLTITFNLPRGIATAPDTPTTPDEPVAGEPRMWIGYMYYDETGATGFTQPDDINENMPKTEIDKALARGGLVEMDPQLLEDYNCGNVENIYEGGAYVCCIYPKTCNYDVYIMSNELTRQYEHFSDVNSEDGTSGFQLCQQGIELINKIDGITYCQSGGYISTDGSKNILAVRQL